MCRLTDGSREILVHNFVCTIFKSVREAIRLLSYSNLSTSLLVILFYLLIVDLLATGIIYIYLILKWKHTPIYNLFCSNKINSDFTMMHISIDVYFRELPFFFYYYFFTNGCEDLSLWCKKKAIKYSSWWEGFKTITLYIFIFLS